MNTQAKSVENPELGLSSEPKNHSDGDRTELWKIVPVEIWKKIFELQGSQHHKFERMKRNKALAKLRYVCKKWCNIIDENIDFCIDIDNKTLSNKRIGHLLLKSCTFSEFTVALESHQILCRDVTVLTDVTLEGRITRENFIWLVTQLPNWKCLKLGQDFFECDDIWITPESLYEENLLKNYWNRLQQLHLECLHENFHKKLKANNLKNFRNLFAIQMPSLKHFRINVHWNAEMLRITTNFLLRNPNVSSADFCCVRTYASIPFPDACQVNPENLKKIRVGSLSIRTLSLYPKDCAAFLPIIKAQNSLVDLRIADTCVSHHASHSLCYGDTLLHVVKNNHVTLTSLNLQSRHCAGLVDAKMFQNMLVLKTLILRTESGPPISYITNFVCLPVSIETLHLEYFNCDNQDFIDFCKSKKMVNLRRFKLTMSDGDLQMTSDALNCLIQKDKLRDLELSSVVLKFFDTKTEEDLENGGNKTCIITSNGFIVPILDVCGRDENRTGDIQVDCKTLQRILI